MKMTTINRTNLIRETAQLTAFFGEVKATGKKLDNDIQLALCSAVVHLHTHGTIVIANNAIESLSKGMRSNAARDFMMEFGPVNWNDKKKAFVFAAKKRVENFEETEKFEEMLATMWLTFRPEPEYKPFDAAAQLASLIKRAERHLADPKEKDLVSQEELAMLKTLADAIGASRKEKAVAEVQEVIEEAAE